MRTLLLQVFPSIWSYAPWSPLASSQECSAKRITIGAGIAIPHGARFPSPCRLPRNKCCSFASCLAKASCTLVGTEAKNYGYGGKQWRTLIQ
jgi:hypothetical protein